MTRTSGTVIKVAHFFAHRGKIEYNTGMKQIIITDQEYDVLTDIFASIAQLDMDEILTDEVTFDQLWDKVIDADNIIIKEETK